MPACVENSLVVEQAQGGQLVEQCIDLAILDEDVQAVGRDNPLQISSIES